MKVRSLGLAILGAGLLASAAALAALLVHDGEGAHVAPAAARPGDRIEVKGALHPFHPEGLTAWTPILALLGNHTYLLPVQDGVHVAVTSDDELPHTVLLLEGQVVHTGPAPDGGRLVVLRVDDWRQPLLFR